MYIAFYISSHGFGHMTRCLSIIENILSTSQYKIYIVCDKKQNDFAKIYLSKFKDRVIYRDIVTDIGLINKDNSLEVDKLSLEQKLIDFTLSWDDTVKSECDLLKNLDIKCVVCDISPIGCMIGNKLGLPTVFVSNFSWVEQYEYIGIDNEIIYKFKKAYSYVNKFIKYDLNLPMDCIKTEETYDVGFICRDIDTSRVRDIKNQYGESIFITCGKSATLDSIKISNFKGTIFSTSGIDIVCNEGCSIVELPIDVLDTQNYISASDIVISKAGWGTIAEGILGHSNLVLIKRPSAKEDSFNIDKIKEKKLGISIRESDLENIDILEIKNSLYDNIDYKKLYTYDNDCQEVVNIILDSIKK